MKLKILVISDTHGYTGNAVSLIEEICPQYIIHLGDMAEDCDELISMYPMKRIICLLGNNDFFCKSYPLERICEIEGKKIFMCHGHKYNVKQSLEPLKKAAKNINADIVLYGHTHRAYTEQLGNMIILNPGSTRTYGLITIENNNVKAEIFEA